MNSKNIDGRLKNGSSQEVEGCGRSKQCKRAENRRESGLN